MGQGCRNLLAQLIQGIRPGTEAWPGDFEYRIFWIRLLRLAIRCPASGLFLCCWLFLLAVGG